MTIQRMTAPGNGRLEWLDAAKGLGIILVVAGHVWTRGPVRDAIYAFHMPLFFLLAGYVARPRPMLECFKAHWRSLAVPYIAFLLMLALADQLIEHMRGHLPIFRSWEGGARALLIGGSELSGPFTIFWFVPCLFFARLMQNALLLRSANIWSGWWVAMMAISFGAGLWIGARYDFSPLGLLSMPVALPLLWLGMGWRLLVNDRLLVALGAVIATVIMLASWPLAPLNMKTGGYGPSLWSLPIALFLSLGICWLARLMPLRVLQNLGRMSLVIMFCHVALIHYCAPYFGKWALLAVALGGSAIIYMLLNGTDFGRRFFLGQQHMVPRGA